MVSHIDPFGPRRELRDRIKAQLATALGILGHGPTLAAEAPRLAAAVMSLFRDVRDDFDEVDITTMGDGEGSVYLWQRSLVATTKPVQVEQKSQPIRRSAHALRGGETT